MPRWKPLPIKARLLDNIDEAVLDDDTAAIENMFTSDKGGLSRFPRLTKIIDLPGDKRVYLRKYKDDLHAVSGGHTYRANLDAKTYEDLTSFIVSGEGRVIFSETEAELLMAAGGAIARLRGERTERLSKDAPDTTHVAFVDGYVIALELRSGRFKHSNNGQYDVWDDLDTFSAEGNPDNLVAAIVTEFNELQLAGTASIEQFDAAPQGSSPFFRRWVLGAGVLKEARYTLLSVDNRTWGINQDREWVSYSSQLGNIDSGPIQETLESIDDVTEAWAEELPISGQRFILIQFPNATNKYGTKGITLLYDYRKQRWGNLFGWNDDLALPERWPGWSIARIGNRVFVGGEGAIYELGGDEGDVSKQQATWRSGHVSRKGSAPMVVQEISMRVKRGVGKYVGPAPIISMRVNKDNKGFGRWVRRDLGLSGKRDMVLRFPKVGECDTVQVEIQVTDSANVEVSEIALGLDERRR